MKDFSTETFGVFPFFNRIIHLGIEKGTNDLYKYLTRMFQYNKLITFDMSLNVINIRYKKELICKFALYDKFVLPDEDSEIKCVSSIRGCLPDNAIYESISLHILEGYIQLVSIITDFNEAKIIKIHNSDLDLDTMDDETNFIQNIYLSNKCKELSFTHEPSYLIKIIKIVHKVYNNYGYIHELNLSSNIDEKISVLNHIFGIKGDKCKS